MKYIRRLAIISTGIFMFLAGAVFEPVHAQESDGDKEKTDRPVIVRRVIYRDPFWYRWYSPWHDPWYRRQSYINPREQYEREKYKRERKVEEELRELRKERENALKDGFIDADEHEEIAEERREYEKALTALNDFKRIYSG